jgi:hypothetical protein
MVRNQQLALTKPARKHLPAQQKAGYLVFRDSARAAQFGHTVAINHEKWFLAALYALDGLDLLKAASLSFQSLIPSKLVRTGDLGCRFICQPAVLPRMAVLRENLFNCNDQIHGQFALT